MQWVSVRLPRTADYIAREHEGMIRNITLVGGCVGQSHPVFLGEDFHRAAGAHVHRSEACVCIEQEYSRFVMGQYIHCSTRE